MGGGAGSRGERAFYVKSEHHFVGVGLNGSGERVICLSRAVRDAYAELSVAYRLFDLVFYGLDVCS